MVPRSGEQIGPYRLEKLLGEGGFGVVYAGRGPDGEQVAVKLLRACFTGDDEARERFMRELALAERIADFCTARVLGADVHGDQPYIVSEFVPGPSLSRLVRSVGPRSGGTLHRLAIGTVTALTAIHRAGVVHRDFTPENVLMGPDGPRVIDFGIARALDGTRSTTQIVGKPAYMAPEQFYGHNLGPWTDMFAWATTMVYAGTGRPPFGWGEPPVLMRRILGDEPDIGALPEPLAGQVARCLAKDAAQRPTAADVLMALLGHGTSAAPAGEAATEGRTTARISGYRSKITRRRVLLASAALGATAAAPLIYESLRTAKPKRTAQGAGTVERTSIGEGRALVGHSNSVISVAFSPDGGTLASGAVDRTARLWDVRTGRKVAVLTGHTGKVRLVGFSPDGETLASGSDDRTVRLWDVRTGRTVAVLTGHTGTVWPAVFSPDGRTLASAGADRTVRLWDVGTGRTVAIWTGHTDTIWSVVFSPDGRTLASASADGTVRLWDVGTGRTIALLTGQTGGADVVDFGPGGRILASGGNDGTVRLWDTRTDQTTTTITEHTSTVYSVAFSPAGNILASSSHDRTLRLWNVRAARSTAVITGLFYTVALSPDDAYLAAAGADGTVRLWGLG